MTEPKSRTVSLATGLDYHLLEWGGDDPSLDHTVFLIHGFLDIAWGWVPMVREAMADRYHIVAPSMRGHGDTDRVGAGGYYHFMDYLADLHELVGRLGRDRVSLVGHSMGGSIASYYTGTFPDQIHRLALLEGTGPPETTTPGPDRIRLWLSGWKRARERTAKSYAGIVEAAAKLRKIDPLLPQELSVELAEHGTRRNDDGTLSFKHDPLHMTMGPYRFRTDNAESFWKNISCPVLLVEGTKSMLRHSPAEAERRRSNFATVETRLVEGAGHMMQRHRPSELGEMLVEFLG